MKIFHRPWWVLPAVSVGTVAVIAAAMVMLLLALLPVDN
jgi:hypothetical protein